MRHWNLECLGYEISDERIEQYKKEEEAKQRKALLAKQKRMEQELENYPIESNEWFSYIAGYTAVGVEWEDLWEGREYLKQEETEDKDEEDFDLPF